MISGKWSYQCPWENWRSDYIVTLILWFFYFRLKQCSCDLFLLSLAQPSPVVRNTTTFFMRTSRKHLTYGGPICSTILLLRRFTILFKFHVLSFFCQLVWFFFSDNTNVCFKLQYMPGNDSLIYNGLIFWSVRLVIIVFWHWIKAFYHISLSIHIHTHTYIEWCMDTGQKFLKFCWSSIQAVILQWKLREVLNTWFVVFFYLGQRSDHYIRFGKAL